MHPIHVRASGPLGLAASVVLSLACAHAGEPELTSGSAAIEEARQQLVDDSAGTPVPPAASPPGTLSTSAPGGPAELAPGAESANGADVAAALERAEKELADARTRSLEADAAYSRMKSRNRPRGAARDEIVRERMAARQALQEAQARYDELKKQ
jgi:hypothetical protein